MLSTSFPTLTTATTTTIFPAKTTAPQPSHCDVRFRRVLTSATSTTSEATATTPNSYLLPHYGMASSTSLYDILGIVADSSDQEIKAAYRRLARVSHPDVAAVDRKDSSADEFMKIHAAYSTLSDPEKRARYDRSLLKLRQPLTTMFSGYSCRNWETDQCW